MRRQMFLSTMTLILSISMFACGNVKDNSVDAQKDAGEEKTNFTGKGFEKSASADVEDIEYQALEEITDWKDMATVTIDGDEVNVDGSGVDVEGTVITITSPGAYNISGSCDDCQIIVDTEDDVKLTLNGVDLSNDDGPVIYGKNSNSIYVELADNTNNSLSDGSTYATDSSGEDIGKAVISAEDDLVFVGNGSLNITGNYKHGICSDDSLYIESGDISISTSGSDGIHANDIVSIDGGTINISAASDMIESESLMVVNAGTITGSSDDEGLEAKGDMYINGGTIDIQTYDDGINVGDYLEINDGNITIKSEYGDALDSNGMYEGCITINGGTLVLESAGAPEEPIDTENFGEIINGGDITTSQNENTMGQGQMIAPRGDGNFPTGDMPAMDGERPALQAPTR